MTQTKISKGPHFGSSKAKLRVKSFKWHVALVWVGGFALLSYIISAATHPLLAWTGPQSTAFRPPAATMQADQLTQIGPILKQYGVQNAIMIKLLPSQNGVLLQVTHNADQPRRYFDLDTATELPDHDEQQALWLARYYALGGDTSVPVKSIEFQTEFDDAYPWVNRLLPVYKVTLDNDEKLNVFVYTEINALAGISNSYKTKVQSIFRNLHTWSWLSGFENVRIILIAFLMLCIFAMTLTGVGMIFLIRRRNNMTRNARVHRWIAVVLWVPLLGFSISGFWHLLHYGFSDVHRGLELGKPFSLAALDSAATVDGLPEQALNQISLIEYQNQLFYRLSLANGSAVEPAKESGGDHAHHSSDKQQREARFNGQATEAGGLYYLVSSGEKASINDQEVAIDIASKRLDLKASLVQKAQLVTHFGPHYDFRNKRLPVWQIDFDSKLGDKVFIDPATGMLVDRLIDLDRYEGYSFSFLHKWSFLTPFTGRMWRDVIVVVVLGLVFLLVILGLIMRSSKTQSAG